MCSCEKLEPERVIKVETGIITGITYTSSCASGIIIDKGEGEITQYGHCWSSSSWDPLTCDHTSQLGTRSSTGDYKSDVTGLKAGTRYHIRAYAINSKGIYYGRVISFTTLTAINPTLTTTAVTSVTDTSASSGGNITDDGGAPVIARGVCWNTVGNPTVASSHTSDGTGTGSFTSNITGLDGNTTCYVRAYATNSAGTAYGNQVSFKTSPSPPDSITDEDGNVYYTVIIGTQTWMQENLKTTSYNDGTSIPLVSDEITWSNLTTPAYCWYDNDEATYGETYGVLYNWYSVHTGKLCPTGWHVPSDAEWNTLISFLGVFPARKLKEDGTIHWISSYKVNNESGFTALPGGKHHNNGAFEQIRYVGYFWTDTEYDAADALNHYVDHYNDGIYGSNYSKKNGFSVRCIKD
jgi:uncharacterized protein (TIGR02145 family)